MLSGVDVLVVPSRFPENCPLVVQDALASGRPCVVPDVGGAAEAVRGGRYGLCFRRGDATSLAAALERMAEPKTLAESRQALQQDRPVLTRAEVVRRYRELYAEITSAG